MKNRHERGPRIPPRSEQLKKRKDEVTRRELGKAVIGWGSAAGFTYGAFKVAEFFRKTGMNKEEVEQLVVHIKEQDQQEEVITRFEKMIDSPLFAEQLRKYSKRYRDSGDLALALDEEHGRAPTVNDPKGRSRIDYVREEVMHGLTDDDIPALVRKELSFYATGMFATETKYQRDLPVGRAKAVGLGQAIPSTYKLYGKTEDEMRYLTHQVDVMRRMFKDYYTILTSEGKDALHAIRTNYFTSDADFQEQFLSLCLVNSYQAGVGNMLTVIKKFATAEVAKKIKGYDVFELMTSLAKDGAFDKHYGEESYNYAKQSTAFAFLLAGSHTKAA